VRTEDQDAKGKKIKRSYRNCWFEVSSAIQIIKFRLMEFLIIFSITQIKADIGAPLRTSMANVVLQPWRGSMSATADISFQH